uniref:Uncharacterized protein n=1 Tax=Anguilla anguilla TaxID=7936 RepID=A0A0E9XMU2_ANGAN
MGVASGLPPRTTFPAFKKCVGQNCSPIKMHISKKHN